MNGSLKIIAICLLCPLAIGAGEPSLIEFHNSVSHGLAYLADQQQGDGSFLPFDEPGPHSAPTALALLAFLGSGHTPASGRYDLTTHNAIDYLLRQAPDDGDLGRADGSGSQGQSIITLALAEAYGVETDSWQRKQLGPTLQSALEAIVASQDSAPGTGKGGWSATAKGPGNLVITAWMVLALDALADTGFNPPRNVLPNATQFAQSCWTKTGFSDSKQPPTTASNAAGALILLLTNKNAFQNPQVKMFAGLRLDAKSKDQFTTEFMLAICALRLHDPAQNKLLDDIRQSIQRQQQDDNSWGILSASATALLTLSTRDHVLPMFNR